MNRVVITGIGWITPMGHDIEGVWKRLLNGESGIARTTIFEASTFPTALQAIAAEKKIKGWRREKKVKLIESQNPAWRDLSADWYSPVIPRSVSDEGSACVPPGGTATAMKSRSSVRSAHGG